MQLLDVPYANLDALLGAGRSMAELEDAPVRAERPLEAATLLAPIVRPPTIWAAGWSYRSHAEEGGRVSSDLDDPFFFLIAPSSVIGPGRPICLPPTAPNSVDYEGELAVVIGTRATDVPPEEALAVVAGFTAANDVSARDVQKGTRPGRQPNVNLAKSFDGFTPMGPCLATLDEFPDPADIGLTTFVDDEQRQSARTSELLYPVAHQVSYLSRYATLAPGDVILTGTPAGVGFSRGSFLAPGNVVRIEIEGVGTLQNPVE